jgi:rubrerythrin
MITEKESLVRKDELAKIFKMAIRAEQRAQKMYQHALAQCDDEDMRGILVGLCEDEARHEREIAALHRELQQFFAIRDGLEGRPHPKSPARMKKQ